LADAKTEAQKQQHILQAQARGVEVVTAPDGNKERLVKGGGLPHRNRGQQIEGHVERLLP
jgi:hypothetical protein